MIVSHRVLRTGETNLYVIKLQPGDNILCLDDGQVYKIGRRFDPLYKTVNAVRRNAGDGGIPYPHYLFVIGNRRFVYPHKED